jgi:Kef-type K+ transport system membrane component KefB
MLQVRIEAIGFGFLVPVFFVVSGANLNVLSIIENPLLTIRFLVYLLIARGLVHYVLYRRTLPDRRERARFALYVATGLPIIVAVTTIETAAGLMQPENAAALVGAGALSVLIFPLLCNAIGRVDRGRAAQARAANTA